MRRILPANVWFVGLVSPVIILYRAVVAVLQLLVRTSAPCGEYVPACHKSMIRNGYILGGPLSQKDSICNGLSIVDIRSKQVAEPVEKAVLPKLTQQARFSGRVSTMCIMSIFD